MSKPVLLAGLLGGVLGAIICFALLRSFPPATKPTTPPTPTASPEARAFAESLIAKLREGKDDELLSLVRQGYGEMSEERFNAEIRAPFHGVRKGFPEVYGKSLGIEFAREQPVSEDIARFVYIERFERGCVVWTVVCYNSPTGWQVAGFQHLKLEAAFQVLR